MYNPRKLDKSFSVKITHADIEHCYFAGEISSLFHLITEYFEVIITKSQA